MNKIQTRCIYWTGIKAFLLMPWGVFAHQHEAVTWRLWVCKAIMFQEVCWWSLKNPRPFDTLRPPWAQGSSAVFVSWEPVSPEHKRKILFPAYRLPAPSSSLVGSLLGFVYSFCVFFLKAFLMPKSPRPQDTWSKAKFRKQGWVVSPKKDMPLFTGINRPQKRV